MDGAVVDAGTVKTTRVTHNIIKSGGNKMTASLFVYFYIVMFTSNLLFIAVAAIRRNTNHLEIFAIALPLLGIALIDNLHTAECYVLGLASCLTGDALVFK